MYQLYGDKGSGAAMVEAALAEIGEPYELVTVALASNAQLDAEYRALNPAGKLPALRSDAGVLTESAAILMALAEWHPEARLLPPAKSFARATAIRWLVYVVAEIYPLIEIRDYPTRFVDGEAAGKALEARVIERLRHALAGRRGCVRGGAVASGGRLLDRGSRHRLRQPLGGRQDVARGALPQDRSAERRGFCAPARRPGLAAAFRRVSETMLSVTRESPDQEDVAVLLRLSDELMASLYPAESNHGLPLAALLAQGVRFFVARDGGRAVGCGGFAARADGSAEIKRMFVAPEARGRGIGARVLERIEQDARGEGVRLLQLETGNTLHEAITLYRRFGYRERGPFGDYAADPLSVFMEKELS